MMAVKSNMTKKGAVIGKFSQRDKGWTLSEKKSSRLRISPQIEVIV